MHEKTIQFSTEHLLFHTLCRSWAPDRTVAQARKYIADALGGRFAEAVLLDLKGTWLESHPREPLICLLSMGSDPTSQIEDLAKKQGKGLLYNAYSFYNCNPAKHNQLIINTALKSSLCIVLKFI